MIADWSKPKAVGVLVLLSGMGFVALTGGLLVLWFILRFLGAASSYWVMLEAVATAAACTTIVGTGLLAYAQIREAAASRHLEVAQSLFEDLNSDQSIEARRWVYQNLRRDPGPGLALVLSDAEAHKKVKCVLNSLDRVAFLTQPGGIPRRLVMPWMNPMIVKSWQCLEPYVRHQSERRREPDYYESVRALGEECIAWRAENVTEEGITWVEDAL